MKLNIRSFALLLVLALVVGGVPASVAVGVPSGTAAPVATITSVVNLAVSAGPFTLGTIDLTSIKDSLLPAAPLLGPSITVDAVSDFKVEITLDTISTGGGSPVADICGDPSALGTGTKAFPTSLSFSVGASINPGLAANNDGAAIPAPIALGANPLICATAVDISSAFGQVNNAAVGASEVATTTLQANLDKIGDRATSETDITWNLTVLITDTTL